MIPVLMMAGPNKSLSASSADRAINKTENRPASIPRSEILTLGIINFIFVVCKCISLKRICANNMKLNPKSESLLRKGFY